MKMEMVFKLLDEKRQGFQRKIESDSGNHEKHLVLFLRQIMVGGNILFLNRTKVECMYPAQNFLNKDVPSVGKGAFAT